MLFRLLFGDSLWRWLDRLGEGYAARRAEVTAAEQASTQAGQPVESPVSDPEYVYPRVERAAMGSLFEIYLAGTDRETLVGAANQALDEIERLDRQLSHYKQDSDVAR